MNKRKKQSLGLGNKDDNSWSPFNFLNKDYFGSSDFKHVTSISFNFLKKFFTFLVVFNSYLNLKHLYHQMKHI